LKKIGGEVVFDDNFNRVSTIVLQKEGNETWVEVRSFNNKYRLSIVVRETMQQEVAASAEVMGKDINSTGHVAIYGIYFDSGKSEIKPESDAAIAEIAKLLQDDGALKVVCRRPYGQRRLLRFQHEAVKGSGGGGGQEPVGQTRDRRRSHGFLWRGVPFSGRIERHGGWKGQKPAGGIGQTIRAKGDPVHR